MESWWENRRRSFAEKVQFHLETHEEDCDIIFSVGAKNEIVKASRLVLSVSSPIFSKLLNKEFRRDECEGQGQRFDVKPIEKKDEIIVLRNVDPKAFRVFLKLLLWDDTSVNKLTKLSLSLEDIFNLLALCKEYQMIELQRDFESLLRMFIKNFPRFIHTQDFINLPEDILAHILQMDYLALDEITIFAYVCKWAESRCHQTQIEASGENIRKMLGKCFNLIRFPVMTTQDFRCRVCPKNILNVEEELALFKYITLPSAEKKILRGSKSDSENVLGFNAIKRSRFVGETVDIFSRFQIVNDPSFVCQSLSEIHSNFFRINGRIAILSIGFLGPIKSNSWYDVDLEIKSYPLSISHAKLRKKVYGRKQKIFRVEFDTPVILESNMKVASPESTLTSVSSDGSVSAECWYEIEFNLRGANTQSMILSQDTTSSLPLQTECGFKIQSKGVEFDCFWESSQMAEIRYERL